MKNLTEAEIKKLGDSIGIDWKVIDLKQLVPGYQVEMEHGTKAGKYNVTNDDPVSTIKIAAAHLLELKDYYTRLKKMEEEGKTEKAISEMVDLFKS
ncbi:MAG: hypothetical protein GX638_16950 [Crenarchaeota archaeon]|nr:hypothetical protein [Thermoproteota archaeon]